MPVLLAAFLAGLASFASPCVIPLVSSFLAYLAGEGGQERAGDDTAPSLFGPLAFVVGFTLVFVALGSFAGGIGQLLVRHRQTVNVVVGSLVVLMGLHIMGVLVVPGLARGGVTLPRRRSGFVLGVSFAVVWTPCVGPFLASVLLLAARSETMAFGSLLLFVYSLGLALPFLLTAMLWRRLATRWSGTGGAGRLLGRIAGLVLVILGVLIILGRLEALVG